MSLIVECECGQRYETPDHNAGRRTRCPECGRVLTVPSPGPGDDVLYIPEVSDPPGRSQAAVASVCLGALLFLGCLSGIPAILLGCSALGEINRNGGRLHGKRTAIVGIVLGVLGCLLTFALLMPARENWTAARHAQCVNNLKQIGLALQQYQQVYGCLPPAAITDKNGRPLLSWRVAILPFLGDDPRRADIRLDEPWDSPHNLALLNETPAVYQCPSDLERPIGMTSYHVIIGLNTAFPPDCRPVTLADITDGTSNTIVVGESHWRVPWTKPDDLPLEMALLPSGLGSYHGEHNKGFNAVFADASVRYLKGTLARNALRALLTRNGGEAIAADSY